MKILRNKQGQQQTTEKTHKEEWDEREISTERRKKKRPWCGRKVGVHTQTDIPTESFFAASRTSRMWSQQQQKSMKSFTVNEQEPNMELDPKVDQIVSCESKKNYRFIIKIN